MKKPVIVLGAGGHAKVVIDMLLLLEITIRGLTDRDPKKSGSSFLGIKILGTDDVLTDFPPDAVELVNAIGAIAPMEVRRKLFQTCRERGYRFPPVIHPSAILAKDVQLGEGVQVMAGTVIQPGTSVGENSILNTRVSIDHDGKIGPHVHLAPGVVLSGGVKIGEGSHIGTGATVIHDITIGPNVMVGAGAVVTENISDGLKVRGVPAKRYA